MSLFATVGLNYYMFRYQMTYGLFPVQDTGLIIGSIQGDQSISFQAMKTKFTQLQTIVQDDPAVDSVVGFTGGRGTNTGFIYVIAEALRPNAKSPPTRSSRGCAASWRRSRARGSSCSRSRT